MLFHDPLYVCAELVDLLADATPGLAHDNAELARELAGTAKLLMQSVTRMRFATGQRYKSLRWRARAQAESRCWPWCTSSMRTATRSRTPGHRDELMARGRHLICLLDRARQPHRRPEP